MQTSDLVLIEEKNIPRAHWKLGRIVEVYVGRDKKGLKKDKKESRL